MVVELECGSRGHERGTYIADWEITVATKVLESNGN